MLDTKVSAKWRLVLVNPWNTRIPALVFLCSSLEYRGVEVTHGPPKRRDLYRVSRAR